MDKLTQSNQDKLPFSIGSPWLAPLAGYSDLPFRLLCREQGAAVCETEMISARGLSYSSSPTLELLRTCASDQPLVAQIFGSDPANMGQAVIMLRKMGFIYIDCNMGCPVRKVMRQGAGAALMGDIKHGMAIAENMLAAARQKGEDLPQRTAAIGFKLRLGVKPGFESFLEFGKRLEELGASWLTLHPRFASEGYAGIARWQEIGRLVDKVNIPVVASGDLYSARAAFACLDQTGAATVMYGRGALSNPAIFNQHSQICAGGDCEELTYQKLEQLVFRHIEHVETNMETGRAFRKMRSIIPRYCRGLKGVHKLRSDLCACGDWQALKTVLKEFFSQAEAA